MHPQAASLSVRDALDDPVLAAAHPRILTGGERLEQPVRWVHTSEVLDIAELLSGGEMLLVAGVILGDSSPDQLRSYLDSLADVGAAALAIERPRVGRIPEALIEQAALRDFPLIELTEVVRFVDVTRALNSRLVNESVRALHFNDEVTHMLAGVLAAQGDLDEMVSGLSELSGCSIVVRSVSGAVLAAAEVPGARPHAHAHVAAVESAGVMIATIEVLPQPGVDLQMITAICRRAPEPLALALLQWRPMTRSDQAVREVFRLLTLAEDTSRGPAQRAETAAALHRATGNLGLAAGGWYVGVVAVSVDGPLQVAELSGALHRDERRVLSEIRDGQFRAVVRCDSRLTSADALETLVGQINSTALPSALRIGVTEPQRELPDVATAMPVAATAALHATETDYVSLARDFTLTHFVAQLDSDAVTQFLDAALGPLRTANRSAELLATLAALFRTGSRVAAAESLQIHRQTMYQRITRIESILGRRLDTSDGSTGALRVAVEIAVTLADR